jgi:tRNA-specific 2-thiouridylase
MVALSGGVDSSVAAALLKQKGHEIVAVTMRIWDGDRIPDREARHACYGPDEEDIEDAARISLSLDIPFHVYDLRSQYKLEVLDYVRREYLSGRTPNPCVRCNRWIKLDRLVDTARKSGLVFDYVATGHYTRVEWSESSHRFLLKTAIDHTKDQSYFLYSLSQEQLGRSLFPLGSYTKQEVRAIASELNLGVDGKPESQDFIAGGYSLLLGLNTRPGPILDTQGNILGEHRGIQFYTVGQRKGLGMSSKSAMYVTRLDPDHNAVYVGEKKDVYGDELICSQLNWIATQELDNVTPARVKIRYNHQAAEAKLEPLYNGKVHVKFKEPQPAITPGQAVVFYSGDLVLGGGTIE